MIQIRSMTATFGKLSAARLELSQGLNIITAPNEGGKSTWAAFLKAMLYGIDTRDRARKGHLAEKSRYQPWSGAPMEGELCLSWQGRDVTLRRFQKGSTPFGGFSAVYTATGEAVPGLTADNCGETLLGVGREVYERSAFIGQGGSLAVTATPELEKRIAALASSGEEDVSFAQVQARLKEWRNRRKVNRSVGRIPELEGELSQVSQALSALRGVIQDAARLDGQRAALEREHAQLTAEADIHRALARQDLNQRYAQAKTDWEAAQEKLSALEREIGKYGPIPGQELLKKAQGDLQYLKVLREEIKRGEEALKQADEAYVQANIALREGPFPDLTGEEAALRTREDAGHYEAALACARKSRGQFPLLQAAGLLLLAGLTAADFFLHGAIQQFFWLGLGCYGLLAVLSVLCLRRGKREAAAAAQILARYGVSSTQQLEALAADHRARVQAVEEAARTAKAARGTLNDTKARHDNCREDLLAFVHGFAPEVRDLFGCSAALSRALNLEHDLTLARERAEAYRRRFSDLAQQGGQEYNTLEYLAPPQRTPQETQLALAEVSAQLRQVSEALNQALGQQKATGDPSALAARKEALERELARNNLEYEAIGLAMEALEQADGLLRERFSPALNQRAGALLAQLTEGRYTAVTLDRALDASAAQPGAILPRNHLSLSQGTADQLYLAVRLAVCQLCLPGPERPPILLDDALAAFDDERLALALELLAQLAREGQILLFTCQNREQAYLSGREDAALLTLDGCNPEGKGI